MKLNPQLVTLDTVIPNNNQFFTDVNKHLPNLQTLKLEVWPSLLTNVFPLQTVRFSNAKSFSLNIANQDILGLSGYILSLVQPLRFESLETIYVATGSEHVLDILIQELILINSKLRKLVLYSGVTTDQFTKLISWLSELKEFIMPCRGPSTRDLIESFLEEVNTTYKQS